MNIELLEISIGELTEDFEDNAEGGVVGFAGKLDIRPPYQREFIYKDKQRDAVIATVNKDFPLNVMYWAVRDDGTFEVIDGQQRTISISQYVNGDFSFENRYFHNLTKDEKQKFLNYKLMIYCCSGTESAKLEWFRTINIAGEKLTEQELRNAVFSGPWVSDVKRYFSRNLAPAYQIGADYMSGSPIRQEYLETALKWISHGKIQSYMAQHQHDANASALWLYFQSVITWVGATFIVKRSIMKGVDWGFLYNKYKDQVFDTTAVEAETKKLIADDDVTKNSGIYSYILTRDERYISIRAFSDAMKLKVYEKQSGICPTCKDKFLISEMEGDHITPWHLGGKSNEENCQMLCKDCNRRKSGH